MLIVLGMLFLLGYLISKMERSAIMRNWDKKRCNFAVMAAAGFFKPKDDPRSATEFATDNFSFCMKTYVDKFMEMAMAPFLKIFGKHTDIANDGLHMLNMLRRLGTKMYNAFLELLDPFFRRFTIATHEMSRIIQYLRMAFRRLNAVVVNTLYQGLTMFRGILNTIQFIIKVIMIICGILLAIIIILIFVLFPFIPLILSVLGAIIATILAMIMVIAGDVDSAMGMKNGFCFAKDTKILVKRNSKIIQVNVSDIIIGDELGDNCGIVTAVLEMSGKDISLYDIKGINVSGSHVVQGEDGIWKLVENDSRAIKSNSKSDILYCFNTSTHKIPVIANNNEIIIFRDWEELEDDDSEGQLLWNYAIFKVLNKSENYSLWKDSIKSDSEISLMSGNTLIKTPNGYTMLSKIKLGDFVIDSSNNYTEVLGVINGEIQGSVESDAKVWKTDLISLETESDTKVWKRINGNVKSGNVLLKGKTLMTESGDFIIQFSEIKNGVEYKSEKIVRDFTDIGYKSIHQTYPMVSERLRIFKNT
jgi:hypothetical protein